MTGQMDRLKMDGWKNNVALTHPYHEGKSYSKFDLIPPSGLADSKTDGWTATFIISLSLKHGDNK